MVEECEGDGLVSGGGVVSGVFICWHGLWAAGLGEVCWEVESSLRRLRPRKIQLRHVLV